MVLLVGRLIRRDRSAARATTNMTTRAERATRETAAIFFTKRWPREVCTIQRWGEANHLSQNQGSSAISCQRSPSRTATYCRTLLTNAGSAVERNFALRPNQSMLFN